LADLKFLKKENSGDLGIGPALTLSELAAHKELRGALLALAQAAGGVASPQIRNTATLGGNLCQKPHCWYFRSEDFSCTRKGGLTCFALDGENQYHAILGNSDGCAIVHPSGTAVALMALDAKIIVKNRDNEKTVPIEEFFVTPAQNIEKENILAEEEIVTEIKIPFEMQKYVSFYMKQKEKQTFDWPLADVAVSLKMNENVCEDSRIVLGSAAPVPWRATKAEAVLNSQAVDKENATKAAESALEDAEPLSLNKYKVPIFKTIIYRTICKAVGIDPID